MKNNFKKNKIVDQVKLINTELEKNKNISVTKLCKKLGLNKSTTITRFNEAGYKYDPDKRKYIKSNEVIDKVQDPGIKELLKMKEQLNEIVLYYNKNIKNKDAKLKINKDNFKGDVKGRYVKVYNNVNKNWMKFCKKNNEYKLQDLYSLALLEFIQRYS